MKDRSALRPGESINFYVEASNIGADACQVSNMTIEYFAPGATPGTTVTTPAILRQNWTYARNAPTDRFGPFKYTVPSVVAATPEVTARVRVKDGVLHDSVITHSVDIDKNVGTPIVVPGITIDKVGSITSGTAPQSVTYTYTVTNTTTYGQALDHVVVRDDLCTNPVYKSGDTNRDGRLQTTEKWTYTCTMIHGVGEFVNTATACADSILDNIPMPVCSPPDTWRVVLTEPPGTPPPPPAPETPTVPAETAVLPQSVNQAPCTLSRVDKVTVRRNQTNRIRVRVRPVDAGSRVTIRLPGGKTVSARTNKSGIATLTFRPTKTGKARVTAAECSDVESVAVRAARKTVSRRTPRVTG